MTLRVEQRDAEQGVAKKVVNNFVVENHFVNSLPGDPEQKNFRRQVSDVSYSRVLPQSVAEPTIIAYAKDLAEELGLASAFVKSGAFADVFSGHALPGNSQPFAMCYGGHQFGNWAGQLGDGRAINLGELRDVQGNFQSLQLKGAGPTPYSRTADGLAVLRSSIREFLCSEAMASLGVPTTRALSIVSTGEQVLRDMFYDGRAEYEPGAVVCRVAPSFIRFGSFEIHAARKEYELLKRLANYTISNYFPGIKMTESDAYLQWFAAIAEQTATMIVDWMRIGFVHGVMNTDNMSIHGLTIDYGPYGWLDNFDPDWTPNTTDAEGRRYRYANQPGIAQWNLLQLANALHPIVQDAEALQGVVENFSRNYHHKWQQMMASKLGLRVFEGAQDEKLFDQLIEVLQITEIDMTLFYRHLASFAAEQDNTSLADNVLVEHFSDCFYQVSSPDELTVAKLGKWLRAYGQRVRQEQREPEQRRKAMNSVNPKFVLRNYLAQLAIDKAHDQDYSLVNTLLEVMRNPYEEQVKFNHYAEKRPDWARQRAGCSMLSCSS